MSLQLIRTRPATIVDGDNTLWRGRAAEGIGKHLLRKELGRLHLGNVLRGMGGKQEVDMIVRTAGGAEGEIKGQQRFYQILIETGLGNRATMTEAVTHFITGHRVERVFDMVSLMLDGGYPAFLATASGTTAARFTQYMLFPSPLTGSVSNVEIFASKTEKLVDFRTPISSGEEKLAAVERMLERYGIQVGDCRVIGDSELDIPLLRAAREPLASPLAVEAVRMLPKIIQIRE